MADLTAKDGQPDGQPDGRAEGNARATDVRATDVKALRDATGAGMMDAKRALVENGGDMDAAAKWLRERGLGKAAERAGRDNAEGAVAAVVDAPVGAAALVQLKCETDFVAKSPDFVNLVNEMAELVAAQGEGATDAKKDAIDDLKVTLKENIELGDVVRFEAAPGSVLARYLHEQSGRGTNGVIIEVAGGDEELAHDVAVHIAFGRPRHLRREDVPSEEVADERAAIEAQTRNEGKPEAAMAKIVEGKINGWYKRIPGGVLLEQPYARDDKQTVAQVLGDATVVRFAQVAIGG
ncbi:MAG TPA: translation elongation factor Ts [Acidimicrobiales bacterium]|jgi:elongation factor Ts|nr:translation elongation factor Ts [Acidimicrobiales bacterium]